MDEKEIEKTAERSIKLANENFRPNKYDLAIEAILTDLSDRRGLKNELAAVDYQVLNEEIKPVWKKILQLLFEE